MGSGANVTFEQWVKWHEMVIESPNFDPAREINVYFESCYNIHSISKLTTFDLGAHHKHCFMDASKHGPILRKLPDWVQVLWDKALES